MRLKNFDLLVAILIAALNIAWLRLPDRLLIVSIILALPLVFFLPGYTLTQILFRKRSAGGSSSSPVTRVRVSDQTPGSIPGMRPGHPIGTPDQIILGLGLSMAIDIVVGFGLNLLPIGLQGLSWTLSLGGLTALFALLAMLVRRKYVVTGEKASRPRITWLDTFFLMLAALIVANAIWFSIIKPPEPQVSFTQFWMLPANPASKICAVSLGIQSFESSSRDYTVVVTVNHQPAATGWPTIMLAPQQKWVQLMSVTPEAQNDLYLEAQLYRTDQPHKMYRNVHLTFHVSTKLQNGLIQQQCTLGTRPFA
jgi:uncharacterized membrane protein